MTRLAKVDAAVRGGRRQRPEDDDVGGGDEEQAPRERPLAQARRLVLKLVQPRAPRDEAIDRPARPGRTAAAPCWRADRRPGGTRSRHRAARCGLRRCCGRARRRSRAAASAWRATRRRARAAPTTRSRRARPPTARPPIMPTSPPAMKSIEYDSGGPVMPRSKSRATVRSAGERWHPPGAPSPAGGRTPRSGGRRGTPRCDRRGCG